MVFPVPDSVRPRRRVAQRSALRPFLLRCESALLVGSALLSSCGPSFEVLAEGDLRFVHCDRLDLDPKIAPSHRLHCWREWRRTYTYGQTRDRVDYAQRRIAEVVSGDTESPFQLPEGEAVTARHRVRPGVKREAVAAAPATSVRGTLTPAVTSVPELDPAELACHHRCEAAHAQCAPGCETRPTGCQRCEQPLEACLGDCKPATPAAGSPGQTKEQRP
jgi:hypothetical protein